MASVSKPKSVIASLLLPATRYPLPARREESQQVLAGEDRDRLAVPGDEGRARALEGGRPRGGRLPRPDQRRRRGGVPSPPRPRPGPPRGRVSSPAPGGAPRRP